MARRGKAIKAEGDVDAIHDMRTATRRLRTAIKLYGDEAKDDDRSAVEDELKRAADRLGDVRDLDVLLEAVDGADDLKDLSPLRRAWLTNGRRMPSGCQTSSGGRAFVARCGGLGPWFVGGDDQPGTIAARAPALIWEQFGQLVAHDIDPAAADPDRIHEVRIAAKKLRYTLEAFEDALRPGTILIEQVTALQDAAGEMHDAIVAGERARAMLGKGNLRRRERSAIDEFATAQGQRAQGLRPAIARTLRTIRSRGFRNRLGRAVAGMGHIAG